ncbi:MAG: hypothetical protein R3B06_06490 [Kofleriaceae bacterium]
MRVALALLLVPAVSAVAAADPTVACEPAGADVVDVDGMIDDWAGIKPARAGGTDPDASFDVRCLITGDTLWLAVDVRDDRLTRGSKADDRLDLVIGSGKGLALALAPGVGRTPPRRALGGKPVPRWLTVEDSLQPAGWSAELAIPLAKVPGYGPSTPAVRLAATLSDGDIPRGTTFEHVVAWTGDLALAGRADLLTSFLAAAKLPATAVTLDAQADVDPTLPGRERVVAAADTVALLTDQFAYVKLPVSRPLDVLKVELVDLRGDGTKVIAARLRQRGGDGVRDLMLWWAASRGRLEPLGGFEVGKEQGARRLTSTWKVVAGKPWAKLTGGARRVIEVRAQPAQGWDEDSYQEAPAGDAEPVHVPWDDDRVGGVFWIGPDGRLATRPIKR